VTVTYLLVSIKHVLHFVRRSLQMFSAAFDIKRQQQRRWRRADFLMKYRNDSGRTFYDPAPLSVVVCVSRCAAFYAD